MKKLAQIAMAVLFAAGALLQSPQSGIAQPAQHVLIEEFTGAWCQYCLNGAVGMQEVLAAYPEDVTVVAIHNGDGMAISNIDADMGPYKSGYPSGTLNRTNIPGIYPLNWIDYIPGMIRNPASVEVSLSKVNYNSINKSLSVTVKATFYNAMSGDMRFNLYIVEDSVVGSGPQFDQVNAFNTDASHPYYNKGNPIKGYAHRHVVRNMLGSSWGTAGSIPMSVTAGQTVTYTYTTTLNSAWKPERIHLVGSVHKYNQDIAQRQILNSVEESLLIRSVKPTLAVAPSPYLIVKPGTTKEQNITVTNPHTAPITVDFAIDDAKTNNPGGWDVTISPSFATIPAGGTADVKATIVIPASTNPALANFAINATPRPTSGIEPKSNSATIFALSDNSKYVYISGLVPIYNGIDKYGSVFTANQDLQKGLVQMQFNEQVMNAYSSVFTAILLPIHGGYFDANNYQNAKIGLPIAAAPGINYPNFAKQISDWINAGKRIFISAPHSLWWAFDQTPQSAQGKNNDATALLANTLGIQLAKSQARFTETQSGNNISVTIDKFNVRGVTGDVIGDQLASLGNPNTPGAGHSFWTDIMSLTSSSKSIPCFFSDEKPANIVGIRFEKGNSKLVYLTFGVESLNGSGPNDFLDRITEYLIGDLKPKLPEISSSTDQLDFGSIEVNNSKELSVDLINIGAAPLTISKVEIAGANDKNFSMTAGALPVTLAANEKKSVTIKFTPDLQQDFLAALIATSNSGGVESSVYSVDLRGKGIVTGPKKSVLTSSLQELNYGKVETSKELTVVLTNNGDKEMTIKSIEFAGADKAKFATKGFKPNSFLGTAAANKKLPVAVVFTPGESGIFSATMVVKSEISGGISDEFTLNATGEGIAASGVREDGIVSGTVLSLSAHPNPISATSIVSYSVNGAAPQIVSINIVDMTGREVMNLGNSTLIPGNYSITLDAAKLTVGAYHIVLRCATETVSLPITVSR